MYKTCSGDIREYEEESLKATTGGDEDLRQCFKAGGLQFCLKTTPSPIPSVLTKPMTLWTELVINLVLAFFKSSCKIEKLCPYYQIKYSSSCLVNISGHNEGKCFGNVFRSGSLTWPKMSGSWGKQKNALYQTLSLSLTSPTSDLIFQTVQCQDKGKKIPLVFFVMQIKYVIPLPDQNIKNIFTLYRYWV